jgi:hypothetical protein
VRSLRRAHRARANDDIGQLAALNRCAAITSSSKLGLNVFELPCTT